MAFLESLLPTIVNVPPGKLGNVVFLPGILGSDLADQANERLWIAPPRFDRLALSPDGVNEADPTRAVHPVAPNFPHAAMLRVLDASWHVLAFAYDWRRSVFETAERLEAAVAIFGGEPFHIVAHSMGGLVARLLLAKHPDIQRGGKLVMIATPNHGSWLAVQALTIDLAAAAFFAAFRVAVSPALAMATARTWPSVYQLLPCPFQDAAIGAFYANPPAGLSRAHLAAAMKLHQTLDAMPAPPRAVYIGGITPLPVTVDGPRLVDVANGDGVVSHRLGFLEGTPVKTFLGGHADLLSNLPLLASITPLLYKPA